MPLDKPNQPYPSSSTSTPQFMPEFIPDPSIRGASWDQLVKNRGIRFIHKMAAPCPNMNRLLDNNHHPQCPFCDGSQIIYVLEKEIWGVLTSNTLEKLFETQGVWEVGTAAVTFPTEYSDGLQADFNTFDKLMCPDFQIRLTDLKEFEPTPSKRQSLKYPIIDIIDMTSISSGVMKKYARGVDFNIVDGSISWISGKEPAYDTINEIGEVLSITYKANPVYNVVQLLHELRVSQEWDAATGTKVARRLPQQVLIKRDHLFKIDNANPDS